MKDEDMNPGKGFDVKQYFYILILWEMLQLKLILLMI